MNVAGFVLAGGRSSRMGADKALLPYRNRRLLEYVAEAVRDAVGSAVIVAPPERYAHLDFPVIPDENPGQGPLGGIITALACSSAEWNLILACDMPGISAGFLRRLLAAAVREHADICLPVSPAGFPEPLCAVYRLRSLPALRAAFEAGVRKVTDAFGGLRIASLKEFDPSWFVNLNTPEDWRAAVKAAGRPRYPQKRKQSDPFRPRG